MTEDLRPTEPTSYVTPIHKVTIPNESNNRNNPFIGSPGPDSINKANTTITGEYGNANGYSQGLNLPIVNPNNLKGAGGNITSKDYKEFVSQIYSTSVNVDSGTSYIQKAPWSLANRYSLYTYSGLHGSSLTILKDSYKDQRSNPLMGGTEAKKPETDIIIEWYKDKFPHLQYRWSDFIYAKNHKYATNNYLLTLRRFATPVEDNIFNKEKKVFKDGLSAAKASAYAAALKKNGGKDPGTIKGEYKDPDPKKKAAEAVKFDINSTQYEELVEIHQDIKPYMAQAVTWWGEETNNSLSDVLTFSFGQKWKSQQTDTTTTESNNQGYTAQPFYQSMANKGTMGLIGESVIDMMRGNNAKNAYRKTNQQAYDPYETTYPNFVIGPVNVINEMQTRDQGLTHEHSIKLVFEYKLKSYGDINPKIALLDILANLMVLTFDNANFWGGANRFIAASGYVAPRFGNDSKLRNGDFKGYLESVTDDVGAGLNNLTTNEKAAKTNNSGNMDKKSNVFTDFWNNLMNGDFSGLSNFSKGLGGSFVGNLLGKLVNKHLGTAPAMQHVKGMITGESTGNWHLTVGNPLNPIATIGNLILESSSLSFGNNLSYEDFPTEFKLEVSLKPARPRDKTEIESIFNAGKGRLYAMPEGQEDFLNLRGKDVKVYGAFQMSESDATKGTKYKSWWESVPGEKTYNNAADLAARYIH